MPVREIETTNEGYPVVAHAGGVLVARKRGFNRVAVAHDLFTGDELWSFDIRARALASEARGAALPGGAFLLPRAKAKALQICRVSIRGDVEVVETIPAAAEPPGRIRASAAGAHAVRVENATYAFGRRFEMDILGWSGETLVLAHPDAAMPRRLRGIRAGEVVWEYELEDFEQPSVRGALVIAIRTIDGSHIRAFDAATSESRWHYVPPEPAWRWLHTEFATLFVMAATPGPGALLATLLPDGTLAGRPAPLGPRDVSIDLIAADAARVLWLAETGRRLACAPLAEPGAIVWETTVPEDVSGYHSYVKGIDVGRPPAIATDAGVVIVCHRRVVLLSAQ